MWNLEWLASASAYLGLVLTVVALAFAVWQGRHSVAHARSLSRIGESLSTRFVGIFPAYLPLLNDLVASARHRLDICAAVPTHGLISARPDWLRFQHLVEQQVLKGLEVSMVCSDVEHRRRLTWTQLGDERGVWARRHSDPDRAELVAQLLRYHAPGEDSGSVTLERFVDVAQKAVEEILRDRSQGIDVVEVPSMITTQFWIADREQAVFAILSLSPDAISHGFFTTDTRLISALLDLKKALERPRRSPPAPGELSEAGSPTRPESATS